MKFSLLFIYFNIFFFFCFIRYSHTNITLIILLRCDLLCLNYLKREYNTKNPKHLFIMKKERKMFRVKYQKITDR